jgi:hypothetical protein
VSYYPNFDLFKNSFLNLYIYYQIKFHQVYFFFKNKFIFLFIRLFFYPINFLDSLFHKSKFFILIIHIVIIFFRFLKLYFIYFFDLLILILSLIFKSQNYIHLNHLFQALLRAILFLFVKGFHFK